MMNEFGPEQDILEALREAETRMVMIARLYGDIRYSLAARLVRANADLAKLTQNLEQTQRYIMATRDLI